MVVAATRDGVLMVESEADQLSEKTMLDAVLFGHEQILPMIAELEALGKQAAKPTRSIPAEPEYAQAWRNQLEADNKDAIRQAYQEQDKQKRVQALDTVP